MPIQINLLAEALAEAEQRRRDPVRRAISFSCLLIALSLVWYSSVWLQHIIAASKLTQIEATIQDHNNDFAEVENNLKKISEANAKLAALQKLTASRFLQGNLLNAMQQLYAPNVQVTRLRIDQSYQHRTTPETKSAPASTTITEHIVFTVDARDSSPNPGDQVNHYKDLLSQQDYFKTNLDTNNGVNLLNLSPPQAVANGKPYVVFTLECHFPDKTR